MPKRDPRLLAFAKQMRREPTSAEARLWSVLRAGRLDGVKFVHQTVTPGAIPDFVARSRKLVVEVDGDAHDFTAVRDTARTAQFEADGYRVLRFKNSDVMQHLEGVVAEIRQALQQSSPPRAEGRLRSSQGEGQSHMLDTLPLSRSRCARPPSPQRGEG
jgi:very-short-patch-repair endonuclease